ncbi:MAG: class I SAM-dependent methyltransferase [Haloarculaceae archaeon]
MGFHTFDPDGAERLEDVSRFRFCSRDELVGALDPDPDGVVADVGSGTGFYTDELAPFAGTVYAVDVQAAMHEYHRSKGVPSNVSLVAADVADLPFADGELDGAVTTMTFHEFASASTLAELRRAVSPGGRLVVADWSAAATGERGPPLDERYDGATAASMLADAGFSVERVQSRPDTFFVVATA